MHGSRPGPDRARKTRSVEQGLGAQRVTLPDRQGGHLDVTCLIACRINAQAHAKPVVWRFLTNRTAATLDAAALLIDWYRAR